MLPSVVWSAYIEFMNARIASALGRMLRNSLCCLLAILVAAITPVASATSVRPMPMAEICSLSGHVCWATVESITPRWADGHHEIESVVRLSGIQYLKGDGPSTAEWIIPGGTLDGFTMAVEGAPSFAVGERWMLFLLPQWRVHPCAGIWQGAFQEIATPQGRIIVGSAGMVTGLGADGHTKYGASTDRGVTAAEWNAIIAPLCVAASPNAAATSVKARADVTTLGPLGDRVWVSHIATPMRGTDGTPLNAPARRAQPGLQRPDAKLTEATPRPRTKAVEPAR